MHRILSVVLCVAMLLCSVCAFAQEEHQFSVRTTESGNQYDMFEIEKLYFDEDHHVNAVSGVYVRVVQDEDGCDAPEKEDDGLGFHYELAPDFHAEMIASSMWDSLDDVVDVTDLYKWYVDAYLEGKEPEGEMRFSVDLPEEERLMADVDFWFVTTKIELDEEGRISFMRWIYVPWG